MMTSADFTQFIAYLKREPHGIPVLSYDAAHILATVWNASRPDPGRKGIKPEDLLPAALSAGGEVKSQLSPRQKAALEKRRGKRRNSHS